VCFCDQDETISGSTEELRYLDKLNDYQIIRFPKKIMHFENKAKNNVGKVQVFLVPTFIAVTFTNCSFCTVQFCTAIAGL
jgi:hypothetical protein